MWPATNIRLTLLLCCCCLAFFSFGRISLKLWPYLLTTISCVEAFWRVIIRVKPLKKMYKLIYLYRYLCHSKTKKKMAKLNCMFIAWVHHSVPKSRTEKCAHSFMWQVCGREARKEEPHGTARHLNLSLCWMCITQIIQNANQKGQTLLCSPDDPN